MIDGVIKYSIEHTFAEAPKFTDYKQLEELRSRLFALGLIGEMNGIGYGNLSVRGKEKKTFFITATQTGEKERLLKEHYTYISDYNFSTFRVDSKGLHKPSSEALSHAMIYEIDPDINCVIHIHSKALWNFMQEKDSLFTTAEYGTKEMVDEISSLYKDSDPFKESIFVMKGHEDGIIAFSKSADEAELILYSLLNEYIKESAT